MQTKISVKPNQNGNNWCSFCVTLVKDGYTVETEYCQAVNTPEDYMQGNTNAVVHALQLLKLIKEEAVDALRPAVPEPLSVTPVQPLPQPPVPQQPQAESTAPSKPLRLPVREDFILLEKQRFITDTAQLMDIEVEVDSNRIDDQLRTIQSLADQFLLPAFNAELEYLSSLLDQPYQLATKFTPALVKQHLNLLDQAEELPQDVMISDVLNLADQMGYEVPEEELGSNPYLFFRKLREEKLHQEMRIDLNKQGSVAA